MEGQVEMYDYKATRGTKVDASVVLLMKSGFSGRSAVTIHGVTIKKC